MKDTARPRVLGLETEYALISKNTNNFLSDQEFNGNFFLRLFPYSPYVLGQYANVFLPNGARVYIDTGEHPEYATPECQSAVSLITCDKAGQKMMERAEIFINECIKNPDSPVLPFNDQEFIDLRHKFKNRLDEKFYPVQIFRNNLSPHLNPAKENISWGSHENYMVSVDAEFPRIQNILTPFLISRQIYGGSGWLNPSKDNTAEFLYAQRPLVTCFQTSGTTTSARPIINTKNEPLADQFKFRRLHLIMGDSNMSPWSSWLKIKATSMVLDIIEDGEFMESKSFSDLQKPVIVFKEISSDLDFSYQFLVDGKQHTALSLQRMYLDLVCRYYLIDQRKEADEETKNAIKLWQLALDTIETRKYSLLAPFFDNFAKLHIFETILSKTGVSLKNSNRRQLRLGADISKDLFSYLKHIDISYHHIYEKESIYSIFQKSKTCRDLKRHLSEKLPLLKRAIASDQEIENAMTEPPPGRAKWRKKVMDLGTIPNQIPPVEYMHINWDNCQVRYKDAENISFSNSDPYCEMTDDLKRTLDRCQNQQ